MQTTDREGRVRDEDARERVVKRQSYGYEMHASLNDETGLITSMVHILRKPMTDTDFVG